MSATNFQCPCCKAWAWFGKPSCDCFSLDPVSNDQLQTAIDTINRAAKEGSLQFQHPDGVYLAAAGVIISSKYRIKPKEPEKMYVVRYRDSKGEQRTRGHYTCLSLAENAARSTASVGHAGVSITEFTESKHLGTP